MGYAPKKRRKYFFIPYYLTRQSLHCVIQVFWMCLREFPGPKPLKSSRQVFCKVCFPKIGPGFSAVALPTSGLDNSLLYGAVLCIVGCSAVALVSTHKSPVLQLLSCPLQLWQPVCLQILQKVLKTKIIPCWDTLGQVSNSNNLIYSYFWPPLTFVLICIILSCTGCFINIFICFAYSDRDHVYTSTSPTAASNSFCLEGSTKCQEIQVLLKKKQ